MTDLSTVSAEAIQQTMEWVNQAKDFAVEQAPLLAREIVVYGIVWHGLGIVFSITALIVAAYLLRLALKRGDVWIEEANDYPPGRLIAALVAMALCGLVAIGLFADHVAPFITVLCAPRLYIIQELGRIVK